MQGLDRKQVRCFLAAVQAGTIRGAATQLALEPSTISRSISALETGLATVLIERGRRGVQLTEAGTLLQDLLRRQEGELETLQSQFDALKGMQRGNVVISVGEGFVSDLLAAAMDGFVRAYPGITYTLNVGSTEDVIHQIKTDQAHLGLAYDVQSDRQVKILARHAQPLMLLMCPDFELPARSGPVTLTEIADIPCAVLASGYGIGAILARAETRAGLRVKATVQTGSIAVLLAFARQGLGVTFLPHFAAMADIADGKLIARAIAEPEFSQSHATLISRHGRQLPRAAHTLGTHLRSKMTAFKSVA